MCTMMPTSFNVSLKKFQFLALLLLLFRFGRAIFCDLPAATCSCSIVPYCFSAPCFILSLAFSCVRDGGMLWRQHLELKAQGCWGGECAEPHPTELEREWWPVGGTHWAAFGPGPGPALELLSSAFHSFGGCILSSVLESSTEPY